MPSARRVAILMADTGGGHRSAATALRQAFVSASPAWEAEVVEALESFGGQAVRRTAALYSPIIRGSPRLWGRLFAMSNGRRRYVACTAWGEVGLRRRLGDYLRQQSYDLVISVHPLFNRALHLIAGGGGLSSPWAVVVTDLVTVHAGWLGGHAARYCLATEEAAIACRSAGVPADELVVTGLPVDERFAAPPLTAAQRAAERERWGFEPRLFTVVLAGGAEGAGGMWQQLQALDALGSGATPPQVVVVCGRNQPLRDRILARRWGLPVHPLGFTERMPELLRMADLLVTKAGPSSVAEGLAAGVPLLVTSALPGQETANIGHVQRAGAGAWVPRTSDLGATVAALSRPGSALHASWREAAGRAGRPAAARAVVEAMVALAPAAPS